jgi:hypothetical protein
MVRLRDWVVCAVTCAAVGAAASPAWALFGDPAEAEGSGMADASNFVGFLVSEAVGWVGSIVGVVAASFIAFLVIRRGLRWARGAV